MGIFQPERYQIQTGPRFTSMPIVLDGTQTFVDVFKGFGYGFQIAAAFPLATDSTYLTVELLGINRVGNDKIIVTPNTWYHGPFQGIKIVPVNANMQFVGVGSFICNIATMPDASINPVETQYPPAASAGGGGGVQTLTSVLPLAGTVPTLAGQGLGFGENAGNLESMYDAHVLVAGGNITGGGVDIWRYDNDKSAWYLVIQGLLLATGAANVGIPEDYAGVRNKHDRIWVTPSATAPITVSGAATTVAVTVRIQ